MDESAAYAETYRLSSAAGEEFPVAVAVGAPCRTNGKRHIATIKMRSAVYR